MTGSFATQIFNLLYRRILFGNTNAIWVATILALAPIHLFAKAPVIVVAPSSSAMEILAARETQRYVYLRSGELLEIRSAKDFPRSGDAIVLTRKDQPLAAAIPQQELRAAVAGLGSQSYVVKSFATKRGRAWVLAGGDDAGTLYAAYRFAEKLGVRFYLHGDVVPDEPMRMTDLPDIDLKESPAFALRGIQPFHDFGEGPDWWNRDDYLAIIGQLPKLRMNFIGLHTYPERNPVVGPESTVWIGQKQDVYPDGNVRFSYPSGYMTTARGWRIHPMPILHFTAGSADLFDGENFGCDPLRGCMTWPKDPGDCNDVFNATGTMLRDAFAFARSIGVKTCIGTETPLCIPQRVKDRLVADGKNPDDPGVVREIYEGVFHRLMKLSAPDYYWFWTDEIWTWDDAKANAAAPVVEKDLMAAIEAAKAVNAPFTLATCGWVLGPPKNRSEFDQILPKDMPFSCINRMVGKSPIEPEFASIQSRPKWAIPWLEDDPNLLGVQLWAGRMFRDAADARRYGCSGLMGIHWRTRSLSPQIGALAAAGWNAEGTVEQQTAAFYRDWAEANFGPNIASGAAAVFQKVDGVHPEPSCEIGHIARNPKPWDDEKARYTFVDEFAALRPQVKGAGNLERFDYWLNSFRYLQAMARLGCTASQFDAALTEARNAPEAEKRKTIAREKALPLRIEAARNWESMMTHLLKTVSTTGELGTVSDLEQVARADLHLGAPYDEELPKLLGGPLPKEAGLSEKYHGPTRIIVPTLRGSVAAGEMLKLKIIALSDELPRVTVYWRKLGKGKFQQTEATHINRGVYSAALPAGDPRLGGLEYYIQAVSPVGDSTFFPATAPKINQTVILLDEQRRPN